ncbi:hypothetical protein E2C05_19290 [Paracraurococcus ruber]|nr:hypothetical protein E2C05_19290 [Paracraurococcus ruber]
MPRFWRRLAARASGIGGGAAVLAVTGTLGALSVLGLVITDNMPSVSAPTSIWRTTPATDLGYRRAGDYRSDVQAALVAVGDVLETGTGAQRTWHNLDTGNRGVVANIGVLGGRLDDCRKLAQRVQLNGAFRENEFVACRQPTDGTWLADLAWEGSSVWHTNRR